MDSFRCFENFVLITCVVHFANMFLTLYSLDASPPVRAVYMTLRALNISDVNFKTVNLFESEHLKEDYVKLNPQHTIPTLVDDDFVIWDSHAIITYLVNKYAPDSYLYPKDLKTRAIIEQRLHFDNGKLYPTLLNLFNPIIRSGEKQYNPKYIEELDTSYGFLEAFLKKDWLASDNFTLADISVVATVSSLTIALPIDAKRYPKLTAWYKRCEKQDFYQANLAGLKDLKEILGSKLQS